jgi:hypothetical protein
MHAYIDESARDGSPGLYVLAGVIVPPDRAEHVRQDLRAALPHGGRRFHYRDESAITERSSPIR